MTDATAPTSPALDFSTFDHDVRVQDDLFRHVNGGWLATAEIPSDRPLAGSFVRLRDEAEEAVRDIITGLADQGAGDDADPETRKVADLYTSFMDEATIETAGAEPLQPPLARVDAVTEMDALVTLLGGFSRRGIGGLFDIEAESDPGDPTRYVMFIGQSGLGLPDEAYYRLDEHAEIRRHYRDHVARALGLAGVADAEADADRVLALETEIASHHWDRVRCRDMRAMYNLRTLDEFVDAAPGLHFRLFLAAAEIDESAFTEMVVTQPSFFTDVAPLLSDDRLADWKAWTRFRLVNALADYLSSDFVNEKFSFYGTVLSGTPQLKDRWKRGVELVEGALGEAVGKIYVQRHFSPVAKQRMDELVANLIEAYRRSITALDWMTDDTKAKALDKLGKFTPKIGYPDVWRDYSSLEIKPDDLLGNVMRASSFELDRSIRKIGQPIDRDEWLMTPQTVNAYYHPLRNEVVFPAAILQPPFFNEHADDAVNYGGIGSVIGHEIGHGFDDQGSTCDGDGRLVNWWTDADREAFETRTKSLIAQYDALEPEQAPGHHVNGALTIGENIGDLGGLSIAYEAFRISLDGQEPEPVDGLTADQRLFCSWGAIWQVKIRTEALLNRLATDPHSPGEFRCNQIVRNLDPFYAAFGVQPGDGLWLDPEQRVSIW
ncbi:putative endopeptidase [Friedmanniella endophytica]|uniref:Putative endopeptidase n=1 Tax=Microlunatus kandeliicorticis TaxID=1759536 RepID=A0A7W3IPE9_9ACTN|nr:M13-type metalloendopeptidase [Microlunatus kandeliicorticis]MBA8792803.1 putative endopeptidase [Microlunatus kandeliicorticis]